MGYCSRCGMWGEHAWNCPNYMTNTASSSATHELNPRGTKEQLEHRIAILEAALWAARTALMDIYANPETSADVRAGKAVSEIDKVLR